VLDIGRPGKPPSRSSAPDDQAKLGHEPVLDGARGAAWLTVFVAHAGLVPEVAAGQVAMFVFFGLSGFLITNLLVDEFSRTGRISLLRFYARRALRLLPALVLFLSAWLLVVALFGHEPWITTVPGGGKGSAEPFTVALAGAGAGLAYLTNWFVIFKVFNTYVPLGHLWSLAVEEQFYLLWAPLLLLLLSKFGRKMAAAITAGLVCLTFLDFIFVKHAGSTSIWEYMGTDVRAGAFLLGGIAAILRPRLTGRQVWVGLRTPVIAICCGTAVFAGWVFDHSVSRFTYDASWIGLSVAAPVLILALVDRPIPGRRPFLSAPVLTYLGRRSYALYLWHYVWLTWLRSLGIVGVLGAFGASVACSELSWRLVERRALSLKQRVVQRAETVNERKSPAETEVMSMPVPVS
jgi:peptidoglycan/LPS O-acetylase OafA/YrhL